QRLSLEMRMPQRAEQKAGEWLVITSGPISGVQAKRFAMRVGLSPEKLPIYGLAAFLIKIESEEERKAKVDLFEPSSHKFMLNLLVKSLKALDTKDEFPSVERCKLDKMREEGYTEATVEPLWFDILIDFAEPDLHGDRLLDLVKSHVKSVESN
ncbi:MAG: hypothetical protein MUP16_08050, partial [Sedimentisphaerales bacterium]|nr:hypothetical protein [Sedimentisphaerales bacterium]